MKDTHPGSSAGIYCQQDGCVEALALSRTTTIAPTHEDDYRRLMPALDMAAVFLGWRVHRSVWWCPAHVVAKKLACARCLVSCSASASCACMSGPCVDAIEGKIE